MQNSTSVHTVSVIVMVLIGAALYFLPTLIAGSRKHNNLMAIGLLNGFLGWTIIGWLGSLIWAVANPARSLSSPPRQ